MNKKINFGPIIFYFIGLNFLAMGTIMSQYSHLGVGSITSFPQIIALILPITIGQALSIFLIALVLMEFILIRKIKVQIFFQLLLAFLFGSLVDFYEVHLGLNHLQLASLTIRVILTIFAIIFSAIGSFIMVKADFILMPNDALVRIISKLTKIKFGKIKFSFDLSTVLVSIILSIIFLGHIAAIGIGTVATAIFVGQFINVFENILNKLKSSKPSSN